MFLLPAAISCSPVSPQPAALPMSQNNQEITLPSPESSGGVSLAETLQNRRSERSFDPGPLSLKEVSQLLWSAQGITSAWGGRTAPSAGALYPLEVYLVSGSVDKLPAGIYKYIPDGHKLLLTREEDYRKQLAAACLGQGWISDAPISIVFAAVYERTTIRYGQRGVTYVHMEVGHAAQNVCLQAVALGLGSVTVGAFNDDSVKNIVGMANEETPLYVIPVGKLR